MKYFGFILMGYPIGGGSNYRISRRIFKAS